MMKLVSTLTGLALDYAVARCENHTVTYTDIKLFKNRRSGIWLPDYKYSTNWAQGGPIIEREKISISYTKKGLIKLNKKFKWSAEKPDYNYLFYGPTPLIAAMRCYIASKLGDEVEIPDELL